MYGFCWSWVHIANLSIDHYAFNVTFHISPVSRFVPTKPKNFRGLCILCFLKLRSNGYVFIKLSWSNSLIYLCNSLIYLSKLTSIYIFKLGISHCVLIGAIEVIHILTIMLAFSVLVLLVHIKNKLFFFRVYRDQWGISGFLFINPDLTGVFLSKWIKNEACDLLRT